MALPEAFPYAQPIVFVDRPRGAPPWPHVEDFGRLCLRATRAADPPAARVLQHLSWAAEVLGFTPARCKREFAREFTSYWARAVAAQRCAPPPLLSLVSPRSVSREIAFVRDAASGRIVAADDRRALLTWLNHRGWAVGAKSVQTSWLARLDGPWSPDAFPAFGRDVLHLVPPPTLEAMLRAGGPHPVLFETTTANGPALAATVLRGPDAKQMVRGFRRASNVPLDFIRQAWAGLPLTLCGVERVDGPWVHGRDHNSEHAVLRDCTVAVVGCGALGSALACLLTQAGVGRLILVDGERLAAANVSRHALGMDALGEYKGCALAARLRREWPHLREVVAFPRAFEALRPHERSLLVDADLVVTAGISVDGDACVDRWRRELGEPPMHLCTWVEAFAIVGHAVLVHGADALMEAFDVDGRATFRVTDWPDGARAVRTEAGCGHAFQPHSAVELHQTIGLAARLALDALLGRATTSTRRIWCADLAAVRRQYGRLLDLDARSFTEQEFRWP